MKETRKIAVLIDGDNADCKLIEQIFDEVSKHGKITIKKVYGDFSSQKISKSWTKELCNLYAIRPMQKYAYISGKNSTDTELIIDAMDILRSCLVEGFCIVSSDSDYTGLANRIREAGMFIMGIGSGERTPQAFIKACETFTFTEILTPAETKESKLSNVKIDKPIELNLIGSLKKSDVKLINQRDIDKAFDMAVNESTGLANFSRFHETLKQIDPTFDYRNFGFNSFRKFCASLESTYTIITHDDKVTMSLKRTE
jgi:uncharacterized LabA/DUF88 family protein